MSTIELSNFEQAYRQSDPPWVIGRSQPAVIALESRGLISGPVLDIGCGEGEHTIMLTGLGYDVIGVDGSATAVERAKKNAARQGVAARFEVGDAMNLGTEQRFDTVLDSALFHVFGEQDRAAYAKSLHPVCRPGALVHVLALSDTQDAGGPRISAQAIRDAFDEGWKIEDLSPDVYRGIAGDEYAASLGVGADEPVDTAAWLARIRRL